MLRTIMLICFLYLSGFINAQNVGIGITTPMARLHVTDSSVVFSATGLAPVTRLYPASAGE